MKRREYLQSCVPKRTKTLWRKIICGKINHTKLALNDIQGECSAASSHEPTAIARDEDENDSIDSSDEEDTYFMERFSEDEGTNLLERETEEQQFRDDCESSVSESEPEFTSTVSGEDKEDIMVSDSLDDRPLYPGKNLTVYEYHVKVFQFDLKHNLTKHAYGDLLNLIEQVLPQSNLALTTKFII